jgi:probable addiction module antidote protein
MENMTIEKVTFAEWDPAEYIDTKEDITAHLGVAFERNDMSFLLRTVGHIVRSEGMSEIARELGVNREELCRSLVPTGTPSFESVTKLLDLLGYRLKLEQKIT